MGSSLNRVSPQKIEQGLQEVDTFQLLADTFQVLGDCSRLRIVWVLSKKEYSVNDLAQIVQMSQPNVSHHLRMLRNMRLVKVRKQGRESFYSIDDKHIGGLLKEGIEHVEDLL